MTNEAQTNNSAQVRESDLDSVQNKIIVSIAGQDFIQDLSLVGLNFESSENEILTRMRPVLQEEFNQDIMSDGDWLYKVRKATANQNVHLIPNSTAG